MESVLVQWDIRTWLEYLGPVLVYFDVPAVLKCPTLCPRCPSHVPMSHHTNTVCKCIMVKKINQNYRKMINIDDYLFKKCVVKKSEKLLKTLIININIYLKYCK